MKYVNDSNVEWQLYKYLYFLMIHDVLIEWEKSAKYAVKHEMF